MRTLVLVLSALLFTSHAAQAAPTPEQRAWFERLSPEEAGKVLQAYEDQQRMERWDAVTRVGVTDLVRTKDIARLNPTEVIPWNQLARLNDKAKVWWAIETPKTAPTPFDVRVEWVHDDVVIQMKTFSVDRPSPNYRLWDMITLKRPGGWTVRVLHGKTTLAQQQFFVD